MLLGLVAPAIAVTLLPSPGVLVRQIAATAEPIEALGSVVLLTAAVVVWGLLAWALVVTGACVLARMPGTAGRVGGTAIRVLMPAAARRVVIVAAGISLVTGMSACGGAAAANAPGPTPSAAAVTASTAPGISAAAVPSGAQGDDGSTQGNEGYADPDPDQPGGGADGTGAGAGGHAGGTGPAGGIGNGHPGGPGTGSTDAVGGATQSGGTTTDDGSGQPPIDLDWPTSDEHGAAGVGSPPEEPMQPPDLRPGTSDLPSRTIPLAPAPTAASVEQPASQPRPPSTTPRSETSAPQLPSGRIVVTVRPGDSLWSIAARQLPQGATDRQIDTAWRAWYAANRDIIGGDPDRILPGERLVAPAGGQTT